MTSVPGKVRRPFTGPRWWRMTTKELREILRDRRTIITLIGMPLLIYPLLGVTFQKLLVMQATSKSSIEYRVAFPNERDSAAFRRLFHQSDLLNAQKLGLPDPSKHVAEGTAEDPIWVFLQANDPNAQVDVDQLVADRSADVGVRLKEGDADGPLLFEFTTRSASQYSVDARRAIEDRLRELNDAVVVQQLREKNSSFVMPIRFRQKSVQAADTGAAFSMATLIPLILILMTVTGAVYPAIDLTAGERERGTLEALISAPVPRHELLFAKYLAVLTVAMLTAIANLTSMFVTAYANGMEHLFFGREGISLGLMGTLLGLLVVFSSFFAAVILILTSFARSFKEAQAYLIPVMLVSLAPGVLCLLPGIEMTGWMSVTPLVNIVILARDVVDGRAHGIWIVASLLSTILYSGAALVVAARLFGTDAVLYGSEGSWADLIQRPRVPHTAASISQAMIVLAFQVPAFLILSGLPTRIFGESAQIRLFGNAIITILLFALLPLLFAKWTSVRIAQGFRLRMPTFVSLIAAILFGLTLWPFAIELARMQSGSLEQSEAVKELYRRVSESLAAIPLPLQLLALAVIPAVCEELFFRGYLLTALRGVLSAAVAIGLSACLFGLFHVIEALSFERFLPTFFLGLILGWICYQSGSIWPGIVMHVTHNGLIISMQEYKTQLEAWGIGAETGDHVPLKWLAVAATGAVVAFGLMKVSSGAAAAAGAEQPSLRPVEGKA